MNESDTGDIERFEQVQLLLWSGTPNADGVKRYVRDSFVVIRAELADYLFTNMLLSEGEISSWLYVEKHELVLGRLWLIAARYFPGLVRSEVFIPAKSNLYLKCWYYAARCFSTAGRAININKLGALTMSQDANIAVTSFLLLARVGKSLKLEESIAHYLEFLKLGLESSRYDLVEAYHTALAELHGVR